MPSVQGRLSGRGDLRLRQVSRAARAGVRLRRDSPDARADRTPAEEPVALSRAAADCRRAAYRLQLRVHAARPLHSAGRTARRRRALHQGRFGQPSDAVVQGSRRVGRRDARGRARVQGAGLRVHRQPGEQRRGARRPPRHRMLRVHSRQSRGREAARLGHLQPDDSRHQRQLRRCEPTVHAGGRSLRLGIREHQPALVLRRGREDDGLRDRRAARMALSAASRVAGRRRHAAAAHRPRAARAARDRSRRRRAAARSTPRRRPAARRS